MMVPLFKLVPAPHFLHSNRYSLATWIQTFSPLVLAACSSESYAGGCDCSCIASVQWVPWLPSTYQRFLRLTTRLEVCWLAPFKLSQLWGEGHYRGMIKIRTPAATWRCGGTKKASSNVLSAWFYLVELRGIEPRTSWLPVMRSPSWATAPQKIVFHAYVQTLYQSFYKVSTFFKSFLQNQNAIFLENR